jgi:hypothetical protein
MTTKAQLRMSRSTLKKDNIVMELQDKLGCSSILLTGYSSLVYL